MDTHRLNIGWFSFAVCQLSNSVHLKHTTLHELSLLIQIQAELVCFFCLSFYILMKTYGYRFWLCRSSPWWWWILQSWDSLNGLMCLKRKCCWAKVIYPHIYSPRSHRGSQGRVFPPCGRGFDLQPAQERHGGDLLAVLLPLRPRLGARV